ncbi:hypothetical protein JCM8547_004685 [Rhodosporidiobolus lusitaniae]
MAAAPMTAQVTYKKQPGILTLSHSTLSFSLASSSSSPSVSIPTSSLSALFASKPGGPRVMLKVQFVPLAPGQDDSHNFTFVSPTSALNDRDRFKDELSAVVARNREREAQAAAGGGGAASSSSSAAQPAPAPSSSNAPSAKGKERAVESPFTSANTPQPPSFSSAAASPAASTSAQGSSQASQFRLRQLVLQSHPQLLALHRQLVQTGALTEAEFWQGREDLLASVAAEEGLMKGKSGEMVDPKTVTGQNGEVTVKITPGLIREIFEEFPVVLRAYNENVPEPLSEAAFWTRYFQSKLFNRNRTTNRAAVDAIKDDAIFDRYLGDEDDGVEPRHEFDESAIGRLLDLKASEEDQHEITNLPRDFTMKPGGQRASLPLMRRFNEHSERLLNQALGAGAGGKARERGYVDPGHAGDRTYYSAIELSDLSTPQAPERIALTLSDRTNATASTSAGSGRAEPAEGEEDGLGGELGERFKRRERERGTVEEVRDEWSGRVGEFEADATATRDAMRDMTTSIAEGADRNRKTGSNSGLPRAHLLTITSLSTSTFEILRHFWSNLLPPSSSLPLSQQPSPKDRAARVEKFRAYLEKSRERVESAVSEAGREGEEVGRRARSALEPVREAVEAALGEYGRRMGTSGGGGGGAKK